MRVREREREKWGGVESGGRACLYFSSSGGCTTVGKVEERKGKEEEEEEKNALSIFATPRLRTQPLFPRDDQKNMDSAKAAVRPLSLKELRLQLRARGLTPAGGLGTLRTRLEEHMAETGDW